MERKVVVIGGGFAGVEAAWAAAQHGAIVILYEMRPNKMTPAHQTGNLGELVCSNSFKSILPTNPSGALKVEMEKLGSLVIPTAKKHAVPAGEALAVDRDKFSEELTRTLENHPRIEVRREEITEIPSDCPVVIATGPLTTDGLAAQIAKLTGSDHLYFYDAVSPTVEASSIDETIAFRQSRYDKGEGADYINCPFNKQEYETFYDALMAAELSPLKEFEDPQFFEGCLPLEEIARRGKKSLSFGPFKPVGLTDPRDGHRPYAVMQLRPENLTGSLWSLVACQTRMKWGAQKEVFRLVPGLQNAEFVRFGVVHRNTYINSPQLLMNTLQLRTDQRIIFAGQMVGVEGYLESAAAGVLAGINAVKVLNSQEAVVLPKETVLGSLMEYISTCPAKKFAPMNSNWGLLPDPEPLPRDKAVKREMKLAAASKAMDEAILEYGLNANAKSEVLI